MLGADSTTRANAMALPSKPTDPQRAAALSVRRTAGPRRRDVVSALALAGPLAAVAGGATGVLLAQDAPPDIDPAGYLVSEKFDGVRARWDGGVLRFRSGRTIAAPRSFLERLPPVALDGELWFGRGRFEALAAAMRRAVPDAREWAAVRYQLFELPGGSGDFRRRAETLVRIARDAAWPQLVAVEQRAVADRAALKRWFDEVVRAGGEGLMLHRADAPLITGRSDALLKLKPQQDEDAVVVGHVPGEGRLAGRLGALEVRTPDGQRLRLGTGFSDAQRADPPPVGSIVVFTYRGRTEGGVPRFASFLRRREPE